MSKEHPKKSSEKNTPIPIPRWLYPFARFFILIVMTLFGPVSIKNKHRVPKKEGLLVVANHLSDADPPVIGYALPRQSFFMAKEELFHIRILGKIIKFFGAFPVKRGAPDRGALKKAIDLIHAGACVVIFPEGEISEDGKLQPLLPGAVLIAKRIDAPVICCGLIGTNRILPCGKLIPRPAFGGVSVAFGEPRVFGKSAPDEEVLNWMENELRQLTGQTKENLG